MYGGNKNYGDNEPNILIEEGMGTDILYNERRHPEGLESHNKNMEKMLAGISFDADELSDSYNQVSDHGITALTLEEYEAGQWSDNEGYEEQYENEGNGEYSVEDEYGFQDHRNVIEA